MYSARGEGGFSRTREAWELLRNSFNGNEDMAAAYRKRLREVAGFEYVPEPLPMKNSRGAVVYYLYFASQNKTGYKVAKRVLDKYREGG